MTVYNAGWHLMWMVPMTALLLGAMILLTLCGIGFAIDRRNRPHGLDRP